MFYLAVNGAKYYVDSSQSNPSYRLYRFFWRLVDWIYPPRCAGCGCLGNRWCRDCQSKIREIYPPYCQKCGIPTKGGKICLNCNSSEPKYDAIRAYAFYEEPLRSALHRLKYHRDIALADLFALNLLNLFSRVQWDVDFITAVPLGVARLKERGYNQSALLAYPLSLATHIPYRSQALKRIRETESQVKLNIRERKENVSNAFYGNRDLVTGKNILIVDDITTTGATLNACASALKNAGANHVYGLTLARTYNNRNI